MALGGLDGLEESHARAKRGSRRGYGVGVDQEAEHCVEALIGDQFDKAQKGSYIERVLSVEGGHADAALLNLIGDRPAAVEAGDVQRDARRMVQSRRQLAHHQWRAADFQVGEEEEDAAVGGHLGIED